MTLLYVVRHGQTDWNRARRFQGHIDIPLNAAGRQEAERLALRLSATRFAAIYCSDLERTRQTSEPCATRVGLTVQSLPALRERNYGIFEGLTAAEIASRYPQESARWMTHDSRFVIPAGESQEGFRDRIFACLDALAARHADDAPLLIVTHGGALDMLYRRAFSLPWDAARSCPVPNAALNRVEVLGDAVRILDWANVEHLAVGWGGPSLGQPEG
jgi:probable phosphoglycerate mutase